MQCNESSVLVRCCCCLLSLLLHIIFAIAHTHIFRAALLSPWRALSQKLTQLCIRCRINTKMQQIIFFSQRSHIHRLVLPCFVFLVIKFHRTNLFENWGSRERSGADFGVSNIASKPNAVRLFVRTIYRSIVRFGETNENESIKFKRCEEAKNNSRVPQSRKSVRGVSLFEVEQ